MLLLAHFLALGVALMIFLWVIYLHRRHRAAHLSHPTAETIFSSDATLPDRPATWLAIRSLEAETVRAALKDQAAFIINRRVNGWVVVTGSGLPNPSDDVDACHRFLTALSRELGHVQFFHMEKFSAHHAWARLDDGCVTRAYAWAGETVWNQGAKTVAENGLGMRCPDYGEDAEVESWIRKEKAATNVENIPRLAARWSLDPGILHRAGGMAGESSRF